MYSSCSEVIVIVHVMRIVVYNSHWPHMTTMLVLFSMPTHLGSWIFVFLAVPNGWSYINSVSFVIICRTPSPILSGNIDLSMITFITVQKPYITRQITTFDVFRHAVSCTYWKHSVAELNQDCLYCAHMRCMQYYWYTDIDSTNLGPNIYPVCTNWLFYYCLMCSGVIMMLTVTEYTPDDVW